MLRPDLTPEEIEAVLSVIGPVVGEKCHDDPSHPLYRAERALDSVLLAHEEAAPSL